MYQKRMFWVNKSWLTLHWTGWHGIVIFGKETDLQ